MSWGERDVSRTGHTVEEEALEGLFDGELGVEDDEPEADGEGVVASVTSEEVSDSGDAVFVEVVGGMVMRL